MICDAVREQPDGKDEDPGELDPRVEGELEKLNKASNDINVLEKELDEARAVFRQRLTDAARSLKQLAKSLGNSIDKARPYFEALNQSKKAQLECQNAAMTYERACQLHKGARDTIAVAEDKLMHNPNMFDQGWQEMLNSANTKILEAEREKVKNENMHLEAALAYRQLETRAMQLERQLRKSVNKARPYFEQRNVYLGYLEEQKARVQELENTYFAAKSQYSNSLRKLESISEEIHRQRNNNSAAISPPSSERRECVGAEGSKLAMNTEFRLDSEGDIDTKLENRSQSIPLGRYRSSLLLDLDIDIDLNDPIDIPLKSPSAQSVDIGCINMKYHDGYQVLDIMPFLEKEKQRRRSLRNSFESHNHVIKERFESPIDIAVSQNQSSNSHRSRAPSINKESCVKSPSKTTDDNKSIDLELSKMNLNIFHRD